MNNDTGISPTWIAAGVLWLLIFAGLLLYIDMAGAESGYTNPYPPEAAAFVLAPQPAGTDSLYYPQPSNISCCPDPNGSIRCITAFSFRQGQYGEDPVFDAIYTDTLGVLRVYKSHQWTCQLPLGIGPQTECILSVSKIETVATEQWIDSGKWFVLIAENTWQDLGEIAFPEGPAYVSITTQTGAGTCPKARLPMQISYPGPGEPGNGGPPIFVTATPMAGG